MPLSLSIEPVGFKEAEKILKGIRNGFPKAAADAINKGLISGRQVGMTDIRKRYNVKEKVLRDEIKVQKANWRTLDGELAARGSMMPVKLFGPKEKRTKGKVVSVSVMIRRGKREIVKGGFMMPGGGVVERRQRERYPLFTVSTIGVPFMISPKPISDEVQKAIATRTSSVLAHNVSTFLAKGKASFR